MSNLTDDFFEAVRLGDIKDMKHLLAQGVDVNSINSDGQTGLHLAAVQGCAEAAVVLIDSGANKNARDRSGNTPEDDARRVHLHYVGNFFRDYKPHDNHLISRKLVEAVRAGDELMALNLIDMGADTNYFSDMSQCRPLHYAVWANNQRMVGFLLSHGADRNVCNSFGWTPQDCARKQGLSGLDDYIAAYTMPENPKTDGWILLARDRVARVMCENALDLKTTEIFDFGLRSYQIVTENFGSKAQSSVFRDFGEFRDIRALQYAKAELERLGGHVEADILKQDTSRNKQLLIKPKPFNPL